ncbi:MAG: hypothetical protein AAGG38_14575, partial [Planctomycetota bacterium]
AEQIHLWFDRDTLLPLRATTRQDDGDTNTVDLFRLVPNPPLAPETFDTAFPPGPDWETQTVPLD